MKLIFIRHGDPDYANDTLTERGWKEAEALSKRVSKWDIDKIYCSPLGRAQDTASVSLKLMNRTAETKDWLREFYIRITDPQTGEGRIPWDLMPAYWTEQPELYDKDGSSVHSNYACFDFTPEVSAASSEKPDMPTNIKTVQSGNKVTIKWDAVQGVTGYKVTFFKDDKYKDILATYDSNSPEYTVTLTAGSTYYCGICSVVSNNGRDIYSNYAAFPLSI